MKNPNRLGTYIQQTTGDETYQAYIPPALPPHPAINLEKLYPLLDQAHLALMELNAQARLLPNNALFVYMYVRKEALLSSQIEGTQSSFTDLLLFENDQKPEIAIEDVEEVSNYVTAINYGLKRMKDGFPLSLRLLCEIHAKLLDGSRGAKKHPGSFRTSQNWIGGSRPGTALFVPPPPDRLMDCLGDLEKFLHDKTIKLPLLIKIGLAHVQFETIHPFLDGNGRLGRLLIILELCEKGLLYEPVLYLSLYFKQHRSLYYELLQQVRTHGTWETWLDFFLEAVCKSAQQAVSTITHMNKLFADDLDKIASLSEAKQLNMIRAMEFLKKVPQVSAISLAEELQMSTPTARATLNELVNLGIIQEMSGQARSKVYVYKKYLAVLEEGTEPFK